MPDGLDRLESRRATKSRSIPPPRNKPRTTPVPVKAADDPGPGSDAAATDVVKDRETKPKSSPGAGPKRRQQPARDAPPAVERLSKHTIHLGPAEDDFLEDVFLAGRRHSGGRVDANRSAVVRLALRRLAAEQTPSQIVEEIRAGTTKQGTGRPRF